MDLNTESPIYTHSDALFVAFVKKHRPKSISFDAIVDLIALLRMHDFDSSQVTFDNVTDMVMYTAENSRISALQRACKKTYVHLPVPQLIVDLVADHLAQESASIFAEKFRFRYCPSRAALLNMALVHRTWTNAAQRVLRQRITFNDSFDSLEGPAIGPWVREMLYMPENYPQTHPSFLVASRACPNVRDLCIAFPRLSHTGPMNEIIKQLPSFCNLTRLGLRNYNCDFDTIDLYKGFKDCVRELEISFLRILQKLPALKTLALWNWNSVLSDPSLFSQIEFGETDPSSLALTSLSWKGGRGMNDIMLPYILCLSKRLTTLELDDYAFFECIESPAASQVVYDKLSEISCFRFHVNFERNKTGCFDLFTKYVKLQQLTIVIWGSLGAPVRTIASTLEHLWIHYSYCHNINAQGICIVETIKRLSNLKTLTITPYDGYVTKLKQFEFKEVQTYCSEKSIELILRDTWPPPFA